VKLVYTIYRASKKLNFWILGCAGGGDKVWHSALPVAVGANADRWSSCFFYLAIGVMDTQLSLVVLPKKVIGHSDPCIFGNCPELRTLLGRED